jgi:hypothetical protein
MPGSVHLKVYVDYALSLINMDEKRNCPTKFSRSPILNLNKICETVYRIHGIINVWIYGNYILSQKRTA